MNVKASALALGLIFLAGCSSKSGGDIEELRKAPASLSEVSELLHGGGPRGGPANQLSDLDKNKHLFPRGYQAVKNGDIITFGACGRWGRATSRRARARRS